MERYSVALAVLALLPATLAIENCTQGLCGGCNATTETCACGGPVCRCAKADIDCKGWCGGMNGARDTSCCSNENPAATLDACGVCGGDGTSCLCSLGVCKVDDKPVAADEGQCVAQSGTWTASEKCQCAGGTVACLYVAEADAFRCDGKKDGALCLCPGNNTKCGKPEACALTGSCEVDGKTTQNVPADTCKGKFTAYNCLCEDRTECRAVADEGFTCGGKKGNARCLCPGNNGVCHKPETCALKEACTDAQGKAIEAANQADCEAKKGTWAHTKCECQDKTSCKYVTEGDKFTCGGEKDKDTCLCPGNNTVCGRPEKCTLKGDCKKKDGSKDADVVKAQCPAETGVFTESKCECAGSAKCLYVPEQKVFRCDGKKDGAECLCPDRSPVCFQTENCTLQGKCTKGDNTQDNVNAESCTDGAFTASQCLCAGTSKCLYVVEEKLYRCGGKGGEIICKCPADNAVCGKPAAQSSSRKDDEDNVRWGSNVWLYAVVPLVLVCAFAAFVWFRFRRINAAAHGSLSSTRGGYTRANDGDDVEIPVVDRTAPAQPSAPRLPQEQEQPHRILSPVRHAQPQPTQAAPPQAQSASGTQAVGWDDDDSWNDDAWSSAKPARNLGGANKQ
eukprot:m51a1_g703 hypothetical protein (621) ;mRNA; r:387925-390251